MFSLFDKDNDDAIPTRQVAAVLRSVGYNPAEQQVRDLLEKYDPEGETTCHCVSLKGQAQAKIIKKSVILFWLLNMTI